MHFEDREKTIMIKIPIYILFKLVCDFCFCINATRMSWLLLLFLFVFFEPANRIVHSNKHRDYTIGRLESISNNTGWFCEKSNEYSSSLATERHLIANERSIYSVFCVHRNWMNPTKCTTNKSLLFAVFFFIMFKR